ncbi:lipid-binding serum glycoprotein family protein [Actinidia rufa]|uniref:Lipid-binding serum glycoprotein family protein n=1 Tax=Actinidia rufa TaxID=165716 RepID=A0A7J0FGM9_9ERIC|nr:lipid-binding serum glycoprotein family protein [Actinidia rufa]
MTAATAAFHSTPVLSPAGSPPQSHYFLPPLAATPRKYFLQPILRRIFSCRRRRKTVLKTHSVEGMEVGLTLGLVNRGGSLELSLMDCGCYVKDITITLDGGASWLYQALPKEIKVDDTASLNVTFVNDLSLSNSSIGLKINGLFTRNGEDALPNNYLKNSQRPVSCTDSSKMLGISLEEDVFNSASTLYYNAKFMQWIVNEVPDKSLLNTAGWRFIVPQLYKKYPNDDMNMNLSLSSPPVIRISANNIDAIVYVDLIIDVLEGPDVIPVACISLVFHGSGSVEVIKNNLAGSVKLNDFSMMLKWSKIGNLRMFLIQPIMWTIIETVFLPYVNLHLAKGFPLPIIHGFTLENAESILLGLLGTGPWILEGRPAQTNRGKQPGRGHSKSLRRGDQTKAITADRILVGLDRAKYSTSPKGEEETALWLWASSMEIAWRGSMLNGGLVLPRSRGFGDKHSGEIMGDQSRDGVRATFLPWSVENFIPHQ